MNIGSNAVKYNHDGGSVTVTCREVSYTDTTAEYELTCTDTGISMSAVSYTHLTLPTN